ncbi:MAG: UDP-3-O-(3-hydroxymyristoyl)glucosamine N-acyltransferase [Deltaproteobacteria bacterium]|nr:UDP-3-O-(3-hydroxymyristoyl)glucosamine N-acyltransferase [Deltaproteobacteria bacterium]
MGDLTVDIPRHKLSELAKRVSGEVLGDGSVEVTGVCALDEPVAGAISFTRELDGSRLAEKVRGAQLAAVLVQHNLRIPAGQLIAKPLIKVDNPLLALCEIIPLFYRPPAIAAGISNKSEIHPTAKIGERVTIGAFSVIGEGVEICDDVEIHPNAVIYPFAKIGPGSKIYAGAVVREYCQLGPGSVLQSGAVIGSDGFGYVFDPKKGLQPVPQIGIVKGEQGVEIGANACVDRGTLGVTAIGAHSKLDNLVQVGHNVRIGSNSVLCGLVGVAGSTTIGSGVTLGGNVGVADHLKIADGVRVAAKSGVTGSILEKGDYAGFPVSKVGVWRRQMVALQKLPGLLKRLKGKVGEEEV